MGLFSSKKEYVAYAASSALFDELPYTLKNNLVQSVVGNTGISDAVFHTVMTDQHSRAKAMFKYAGKEEDGYLRGLPTSNMNLVTVEPVAVEAALTRAVGSYDTILHTYRGRWNERFFLSKAIQFVFTNQTYFPWAGIPPNTAHWDGRQDTTIIPVHNSTDDAYYVADNDFEFERGNNLNPLGEDLEAELGPDWWATHQPTTDENYKVWFNYVDDAGLDQKWYIAKKFDVGDAFSKQWIMVEYSIGTRVYYWSYEIDSGEDPIFESALDVQAKSASFMPVIVLMQDKVWFDKDPNSKLAITTNKLVKKLSTTGTEIREDFLEQEAEDNASGDADKTDAEKWDFFIHYAIPADSVVRGSREYLWYFLLSVYLF